VKVALPRNVLTSNVFPFVGVKTLKRCAAVCKEWRAAVDEDVVWKHHCLLLWRGKKMVPKILRNEHGDEEPETLYPYAIYGPDCKMTLRDVKQILQARDVDTSRFLEKSEYMNALAQSQPKAISGWRFVYPSKWKTSYVYSAVRATDSRFTRHELITSYWKMEFKFNGMTCESKFLGDGTYWSTMGNINNQGTLHWTFVTDSGVKAFGNSEFDYPAVRVSEYPDLVAQRRDDWSFELHNDYVVFRQMTTPAS